MLAVAGLFSICHGSDYGENQRLIYHKVLTDLMPDRPMRLHSYEVGGDEYKGYARKLASLRNKKAPDWSVELGKTFDFLKQPVEGLTEVELIERVGLAQDADDCLYLATMAGRKEASPFDVLYHGKKWLKKAAGMGRPGADFILQVLLAQENRLPVPLSCLKKGAGEPGDRLVPSCEGQYIQSLPGYEDFKALMEQGDVALYKVLRFFEPGASATPLDEAIKTALKEKGDKGDKVARRQLAELELTSPFAMNFRVNVGKKGEEDFSEKRAQYESYLGASRELQKWAGEGDLQAMYAWMSYGLRFERTYDPQTWHDIFAFSDRLVGKGYVNVLRQLKNETTHSMVFFLFPWGLLNQYYSANSVAKMEQAASASLIRRKDFTYLYNDLIGHFFWGANSLGREKLDWLLDDMMTPFLQVYGAYKKLLERFLDPQDQNRVRTYVEKQAGRGYPEAKLALADIWNQGAFGARDVNKALELWKEIWRDVKKYNTELKVYCESKSEDGISIAFELSDTASECLAELVTFYLSRENEAAVLSLAREYAGMPAMESELKDKGCHFFLPGRLYELGIGTTPDRGKAIEYYKRGVRLSGEHASYEALKRLREEGYFRGKEADELMAGYRWKVGRGSSRVTERLKRTLDIFLRGKNEKQAG